MCFTLIVCMCVGPYTIGLDRFMVTICKYAPLDPERLPLNIPQNKRSWRKRIWNDSIAEADAVYREKMHNLCCENCHRKYYYKYLYKRIMHA